MENKKFSSLEEIEKELEILKLDKEIHFQKLILSTQKARENLTFLNVAKGFFTSPKKNQNDIKSFLEPKNFVAKLLTTNKSAVASTSLNVAKFLLPFVLNKFIKNKRGK